MIFEIEITHDGSVVDRKINKRLKGKKKEEISSIKLLVNLIVSFQQQGRPS